MIPRRFKFNPRQVRDYFQTAKRKFSQSFTFYFKAESTGSLKVLVVVPKKTALLATKRNRIKRQVYSLVLPILQENEQLPFSTVIVVNGAAESNLDSWSKELEGLFSQLPNHVA